MSLHIDLETFSSVDIRTSGMYRYFDSPDFEILLVAYSISTGPVKVVDLASGEPMPAELIQALADPYMLKHAHNAAFERLALSSYGYHVPTEQWHCTMIKAAYCGLPLSLDMVGKALGIGSDAKQTEGKALIRYFCQPCKPTKANGMRTRNLPEHDPAKWEAFKDYCRGDVTAERRIVRELEGYTVPPAERAMWLLDQQINDRGISVDTTLARAAVELDAISAAGLDLRMRQITGLDNPGSVTQLKGWLSDAMQRDVASLAKADVADLLETAASDAAREVLSLRVKSAKTSTKKYEAMLACAGADSRARGLLQFYGANRTGRWAGRLVQVQNLPQNHLRDLDLARTVVRSADPDLAALLFDDIGSVLSQLVRTAFIAKPGHTLAVADFSAIEARVIAWLAGEDWRMQVFNTHGKIYEASAAMMFRVPIESVTKGSDLRQKGKIAELALGYGGSLGALKQMGGESMGLSDPEMTEIVARWRTANPSIVELWADVETAATLAVKTGRVHSIGRRGVCFAYDGVNLTATLPSERKLFYHRPSFGPNRFGSTSLRYKGVDQTTKQWTNVDTYGGKLVENLVQAIARDLLAGSMLALAEDAYEIVMHVHDEVVCEIPSAGSDASLERMCAIMSRPAPWAPDLPNRADGYTTPFYRKSD
jgi:DNA polymerase bacteriophage-type